MTNRRFYLECEAGVAGDMLVGALLDLGADKDKLIAVLDSLPLEGYFVNISRVIKSGIDACDFDVVLRDDISVDHDMEYLHGNAAPHRPNNPAAHGGGEHHHSSGHHHLHHHHRHIGEIYDIIDAGRMSGRAKSIAKNIFMTLGRAESAAHGVPIEEVHFHEVGAIDSIVDIVSVAVCVDDLGIDSLIVPYLSEGEGSVRCAHGIMPIPVPAVSNIIQAHGIPLRRMEIKGEFVTPTGAAAVAALRSEDKLPSSYRVLRMGVGAGKREYERASIIRIYEIEPIEASGGSFVWKLETDIDDSTGERLGYVMRTLYDNGALEVHHTPVFMKKNRPGTELVVICEDALRERLEQIIFMETTTIGIRRIKMERSVLPRSVEEWDTPMGPVSVKRITLCDGSERIEPEFDSVERLAIQRGISYSESLEWIKEIIRSVSNRGNI